MSARTSAVPATGRGFQPVAYGRPSSALLARAARGYARFLAQAVPDDRAGDQDLDATRRR